MGKNEAAGPAGGEVDYWFRRIIVEVGGVGMGCGCRKEFIKVAIAGSRLHTRQVYT